MKVVTLLLVLVVGAWADIYLQNPRGCNDRLNEANQDRNNGNRLFNTENNARGGYAWGPAMTFYAGSKLPIQWTAQHGCGSDQVTCNIVIQYMCTNPTKDPAAIALRDGSGSTTNTIPDDPNQFNQKDTNGQYTYGMHESYQYYQDCKARERNKGLFIADQGNNIGTAAINTRQSPGGTRSGFECTEERDYYPYWHPSPWKDIAVMSPSQQLCDYFKAESQNVKDKNYCKATTTTAASVPNYQADCKAKGGVWSTQPSWGIPAPDCQIAQFSRDNHLGNTITGGTAEYNWTIPAEACASQGGCDCALRIRYNVSNANTLNWPPLGDFNDATDNGLNSPVTQDPITLVESSELQLALNTNQYGRTFEDRSFTFHIANRPANVPDDAPIYNLNVRGKRGNIVQVYPATEYDFVPNDLNIVEGDYVHFQWTGSDFNPTNNAGQGVAGTDRSNLVQTLSLNDNIPLTDAQLASGTADPLFDTHTLRQNMALLGQSNCPTVASLITKNGNQAAANVDPTNCAKLNAAPVYYNAGPLRVNRSGTYTYMSTRNNDFSNRTQKGKLTVAPAPELSDSNVAAIVVCTLLGVIAVAAVVCVVYARKFPHSKLGQFYSRIPKPSFGKSAAPAGSERKEPLLG